MAILYILWSLHFCNPAALGSNHELSKDLCFVSRIPSRSAKEVIYDDTCICLFGMVFRVFAQECGYFLAFLYLFEHTSQYS
jgi:hypothetical protein